MLLQLDTGEYFGLDEVGQRMWTLMVEHGDLAVVAARLLEEFDVEPEALSRDLDELVDDLVSRRLWISSRPPGAPRPGSHSSVVTEAGCN